MRSSLSPEDILYRQAAVEVLLYGKVKVDTALKIAERGMNIDTVVEDIQKELAQ